MKAQSTIIFIGLILLFIGVLLLSSNITALISVLNATTSTTSSIASTSTSTSTSTSITTTTVPISNLTAYAHYHLNETSGTNAYDSSGNNRNGTTINSPSWVVGKLNNSINLNGNQAITLGNIADFERTDNFSIEAWTYPTSAVGQQGIVAKEMNSSTYTGWSVDFVSAKISVYMVNSWSSNVLMVTTTNTYPLSIWSHIVVTYDGTSTPNGIKIYVNGTIQTTSTNYNTLTGTIKNSEPTRIGQGQTGMAWYYGKIDEVVIYNMTLSAEDVTFRYNSGMGIEEPPL
jgi:hypothetical protein